MKTFVTILAVAFFGLACLIGSAYTFEKPDPRTKLGWQTRFEVFGNGYLWSFGPTFRTTRIGDEATPGYKWRKDSYYGIAWERQVSEKSDDVFRSFWNNKQDNQIYKSDPSNWDFSWDIADLFRSIKRKSYKISQDGPNIQTVANNSNAKAFDTKAIEPGVCESYGEYVFCKVAEGATFGKLCMRVYGTNDPRAMEEIRKRSQTSPLFLPLKDVNQLDVGMLLILPAPKTILLN